MADFAHLQHDPRPSSAEAQAIRPRGGFRTLPGMLHGALQPVAAFEVEVMRGAYADAGLDVALLDVAGEFVLRPSEDAGPRGIAERVAALAMGLQSHFGLPIQEFTHIAALDGTETHAAYRLHVPYHEGAAARQATAWAIRAVNLLIEGRYDTATITRLRSELAKLGVELRQRAPESLNTFNFIRSAWQLGVPVSPVVGNVMRFGLGRHARLLDSTFTDRTGVIGTKIARNKAATAVLLRQGGLPAPQHVLAASREAAIGAARRLGYPLVVKPVDADGGRGVYAGLRDEAALIAAAERTLAQARQILVERHFHGLDFRLTVFAGEVVKVEQRLACGVYGDGVSTIAQLVASAQASERFRKIQHNYGRMVIALDEEAEGLLAEQELTAATVVEAGRRVTLRRKNNVSSGGEQIAVAVAAVHPDNLALALRAADLLMLDVAGVDLLIGDIGVSWRESGALICEVNGQPQIGLRTSPVIYAQLLDRLLVERGHIPVHLIVAEPHQTVSPEALARRAADLGCNAVAAHDRASIGGVEVMADGLDAFGWLRLLLADPRVDGAVCVMTPAQIAQTGLPCARLASVTMLEGADRSEIEAALAPHTDNLVKHAPHA